MVKVRIRVMCSVMVPVRVVVSVDIRVRFSVRHKGRIRVRVMIKVGVRPPAPPLWVLPAYPARYGTRVCRLGRLRSCKSPLGSPVGSQQKDCHQQESSMPALATLSALHCETRSAISLSEPPNSL